MMQYMTVKTVLTEKESRRIFRQLVSGMDQIHKANIVHRDLKLENLLLDEDRNILISDFGLGRTYHSDQVHLLKTFCGTPNYAAVELISGIPYVGVKSDIWAMGIILYFLNTGTTPFQGTTLKELYDNIKNVRYKSITDRSLRITFIM
jgi:serine/threonine protein kinase